MAASWSVWLEVRVEAEGRRYVRKDIGASLSGPGCSTVEAEPHWVHTEDFDCTWLPQRDKEQ